MDIHKMKRKELQALCKKHGIPANLTNRELANRLNLAFKENEKPGNQGESCSKNLEETVSENESRVLNRKVKKVRFSPENQTIIYPCPDSDQENTLTKEREARWRRRTMVKQAATEPVQVMEDTGNSEHSEKILNSTVRITRYRAQKSVDGRKRAQKGAKIESSEVEIACVSEKLLPVVELSDNGRAEGNKGLVRRQLRSREVVVEIRGEVEDGDVVVPRKNLTQRGSKRMRNAKGGDGVVSSDGISEGEVLAEEAAELGKVPRRSTRNTRKDAGSELLSGDSVKSGIVGRITRLQTQVTGKASAVESKAGSGTEVQVQEECEKVLQLEVPSKDYRRNSSRQKSVVPQKRQGKVSSEGALVDNEIRKRSRNTFLEGASEVKARVTLLKENEKVSLPNGPPRRSRRNAVMSKSFGTHDGELEIHELVGRDKLLKQLRGLKKTASTKGSDRVFLLDEIPQDNAIAEGAEPGKAVKRSRQNLTKDNNSAALGVRLGKIEIVGRSTRFQTRFETKASAVETETETVEVPDGFPETEASVEPIKENEKASLPNISRRKSMWNVLMFKPTAPPDGELEIHVTAGKHKKLKQLREPLPEEPLEDETSEPEGKLLIEEPMRRSTRSASKHGLVAAARATSKAVGEKQQRKARKPVLEEEAPLNKSSLVLEEPPIEHAGLVVREAAENKYGTVLTEGFPETEASVEPIKENEKASLPNISLRRSMRNIMMFNSTSPPDGELGIHVTAGKHKKLKQLREPLPEEPLEDETSEPEGKLLIEEPLRRFTRSASKHGLVAAARATSKAVGEKQQRKARKPVLEEEAPLNKSSLVLEESPIEHAGLAVCEAAENKYDTVLSCSKDIPEGSTKKRKRSGNKSVAKKGLSSMEVSAEKSDIEEVTDITENLDENLGPGSVKSLGVSTDQEKQISISESLVALEKENVMMGDEKEKLHHDDIHVDNEDDHSCLSPNRSDSDHDDVVEAKSVQSHNKLSNVVFSEITSPADGFSPVYQSDNAGKLDNLLELEKHLVTEQSTSTYIYPRSDNVDGDAADDEKTEGANGMTEPIVHRSVFEDHPSEANKRRGLEKISENASGEAKEISAFEDKLAELEEANGDSGPVAHVTVFEDHLSEDNGSGDLVRNSENTPEEAKEPIVHGSVFEDHPSEANERRGLEKNSENASGEAKEISALEEKLAELEEAHGNSGPIVHGTVFEDHPSEDNESRDLVRDSENATEEAKESSVLDPSDGFDQAEVREIISDSHLVTAEIGAETVTEIQFISGGHCATGTAPLKPSPAHENQEGNQPDETEIHGGTRCRCETFVSKEGNEMYCRERNEEVVEAKENDHKEASDKGRASPAVGEEYFNADPKGNILADGSVLPVIDKLDGEFANEKENNMSGGNLNNVSEKTRETCVHKLSDGEVISMITPERKGIKRVEDTFAPQSPGTSYKASCELTLLRENDEHEQGKADNLLDLGKELETEEEPSRCKCTHSKSDYAVDHVDEDDKTSVYEERNLTELEEANRAAKPITHESVFEENLGESNESRGTKRDSVHTSEEADGLGVHDPSDGKGIAQAENFEQAVEIQEIILDSHIVTAGSSAENITEIQLSTSGYCATATPHFESTLALENPVLVIGGKVIHHSGHALSIDNDDQEEEGSLPEAQNIAESTMLEISNTNHVEREEYSGQEIDFPGETISRGETSISIEGDGMGSQERVGEVKTTKDNESGEALHDGRASPAVQEEITYEGFSLVHGNLVPILHKSDGQVAEEKANKVSEGNIEDCSVEGKTEVEVTSDSNGGKAFPSEEPSELSISKLALKKVNDREDVVAKRNSSIDTVEDVHFTEICSDSDVVNGDGMERESDFEQYGHVTKGESDELISMDGEAADIVEILRTYEGNLNFSDSISDTKKEDNVDTVPLATPDDISDYLVEEKDVYVNDNGLATLDNACENIRVAVDEDGVVTMDGKIGSEDGSSSKLDNKNSAEVNLFSDSCGKPEIGSSSSSHENKTLVFRVESGMFTSWEMNLFLRDDK